MDQKGRNFTELNMDLVSVSNNDWSSTVSFPVVLSQSFQRKNVKRRLGSSFLGEYYFVLTVLLRTVDVLINMCSSSPPSRVHKSSVKILYSI